MPHQLAWIGPAFPRHLSRVLR